MIGFVICVKNKYVNSLINIGCKCFKIKYFDDFCYLYLDRFNFDLVYKYREIFDIEFVSYYGLYRLFYGIRDNFLFFLCNCFGFLFFIFLSNYIFSVNIICDNKDIVDIVYKDCYKYGIRRFNRVFSFDEVKEIENSIILSNKDLIEWISIKRVGNNYYVNVLDRKINNISDSTVRRDLVSKKDATIYSISVSRGNVIKRSGDVVKKGDVIVSGCINKGDECKDEVNSFGSVLGEVWYNVSVVVPKDYRLKIFTGNSINRFSIRFNDKYFGIFNNSFSNFDVDDFSIFRSNFFDFSFNFSKIREFYYEDFISDDDFVDLAYRVSYDKLSSYLDKGSKIISKNKLKMYEKDSKIYIDVFYKVIEDITSYIEY